MHRHQIEHVIVTALGFFLGALVAISIAPGDAPFAIAAGIVVGLFAREFVDRQFAGEWFWPLARPADPKNDLRSKSTASHR